MVRNVFRWVALAEGFSWLCLLVAMVFKYGWGMPEGVQVVGMIHGLLFIAYVATAAALWQEARFGAKTAAIILIGSIIPMGAWYVERHLDRLLKDRSPATTG